MKKTASLSCYIVKLTASMNCVTVDNESLLSSGVGGTVAVVGTVAVDGTAAVVGTAAAVVAVNSDSCVW